MVRTCSPIHARDTQSTAANAAEHSLALMHYHGHLHLTITHHASTLTHEQQWTGESL